MRGDACTVPPHATLRVNNDVTTMPVRADWSRNDKSIRKELL